MTKTRQRLRQVMDWRAALIAGVVAGTVTLLLQLILIAALTGGSPWFVLYHIAGLVLGPDAVLGVTGFEVGPALLGLLLHFVLAILFTLLLAFIIHRWGLVVGIVGGALFGLALYGINYYTFTIFFPWFYPFRSWVVILIHVVFGAVAGGTYEALEEEIYVPA